MRLRNKPRRGMTLTEMLVATFVAALLIALVLPAVQQARDSARRTSCANNMRQIGIAVQNYESVYRRVPGNYNAPWPVGVCGFLEQQNLYGRFNHQLNACWHPNIILGELPNSLFKCPSQQELRVTPHNWTVSHYAFSEDTLGTQLASITDGLSNTGLAFETTWELQLLIFDGPAYYISREKVHSGNICTLLMCDGSVRPLNENVGEMVMESLRTIAGGEVVPTF